MDRLLEYSEGYNEEHQAKYKAYHPDGTIVMHSYDEEPTFKHLYEIIDCNLVQGLPGTDFSMFVDEEGKLKGQDVNFNGTMRWQEVMAEEFEWQYYNGDLTLYDCANGITVELIDCVFD